MTTLLAVVVAVAVVLATLCSVVAVVGFVRLPDVYTRLHATGMVATFSAVFLLAATPMLMGVPVVKAVALIAFLLITAPVGAHAISSAAYRVGIPLKGKGETPVPDALSEPDKR